MAEKSAHKNKQVQGRRRVSAGNRVRHPRLNALQKHQRGRRIAAMRARVKPTAWKTIAAEVGMSVSGAKDAHEQFLAAEEAMLDNPLAVVDETIDAMTVAIDRQLRNAEAAGAGTSTSVQALRAAVDTAVLRLTIMRQAGRAPRSLAAPTIAAQVQLVFREFAELLRRHQVRDEVLRDLLALAESQMGRMTAIEGRELPTPTGVPHDR